jgi:hypothetical protein
VEEIMVSKLRIKGLIPKTKSRKKSDVIKERKRKKGIRGDCDWTVKGSPSIELPNISDLELSKSELSKLEL